jgi:4-amino-4-deoxy-L-arabinose transferase-like glycosyltransferase
MTVSTMQYQPLSHTLPFWWTLTLIIKLVLGALVPLFSDEAYYWTWSHHLQLSYYNHPPFIAWLFWLGQVFEPLGHACRWPGILLGHLTLIPWYLLLKPYLSQDKLRVWFLVMVCMPFTGPGSLIMVPDVPLMFFWSLAIFAMVHALSSGQYRWYVCLGLAIGLGFCSKYHMVLFPGILVVWLTIRQHWNRIGWCQFLVTFVTTLCFALPVLIWNWQHDFVSFTLQLRHGLGASSWQPRWTIAYVLGQIALAFPLIIWAAKRHNLPRTLEWLPWFCWGPLLFFFLTSFKGRVEANWPIVAYPSLIALAIIQAESLYWIKKMLLVWIIGLLLVLSQIASPWIPLPPKYLQTRELMQYKPLMSPAKHFQPLFANSHQMAAQLSYYLKSPVYKLRGLGRKDAYDFRPESLPRTDIWFVAVDQGQQLPAWVYAQGYAEDARIQIDQTYDIVVVTKNPRALHEK